MARLIDAGQLGADLALGLNVLLMSADDLQRGRAGQSLRLANIGRGEARFMRYQAGYLADRTETRAVDMDPIRRLDQRPPIERVEMCDRVFRLQASDLELVADGRHRTAITAVVEILVRGPRQGNPRRRPGRPWVGCRIGRHGSRRHSGIGLRGQRHCGGRLPARAVMPPGMWRCGLARALGTRSSGTRALGTRASTGAEDQGAKPDDGHAPPNGPDRVMKFGRHGVAHGWGLWGALAAAFRNGGQPNR